MRYRRRVVRESADEVAGEAVEAELREFAEPVERPGEADPGFAEKLRERLWRMLRERLGRERSGTEPLD